jgi:hypothetical protein
LSSDINHNGVFDSVSAGNYLIYNINEKLGVGGRAEWLKYNGSSYYETTLGVNIKPTGNLIVRPEIRHNWSPAAQAGGDPLANPALADQTIFGVDAIFQF